jgi:hypothetical protein
VVGIGSFYSFQSAVRLNAPGASQVSGSSAGDQESEALMRRLRRAVILESTAQSVTTLLAPGMEGTLSARTSSMVLNGDKSNTYDIFRFVANKCQNELGCSREQAALMTLQVMQDAIQQEGGRFTLNLAFKAYRQQLDLGSPSASA